MLKQNVPEDPRFCIQCRQGPEPRPDPLHGTYFFCKYLVKMVWGLTSFAVPVKDGKLWQFISLVSAVIFLIRCCQAQMGHFHLSLDPLHVALRHTKQSSHAYGWEILIGKINGKVYSNFKSPYFCQKCTKHFFSDPSFNSWSFDSADPLLSYFFFQV